MTEAPSGGSSPGPPTGSASSGTTSDSAKLETGAEPPSQATDQQTRAPHWLLESHRWLDRRVPAHTRRRLGQVLGFGAAIVGTLIAFDLARSLGLAIPSGLAALVGLFLANWIGNGGILVPIPGLRIVGWVMVVHQGAGDQPILVGLIAGIAMALGQMSWYLKSAGGSDSAHESQGAPRFARLSEALRRAKHRTAELIERHGIATMFTLSLLPSPLTTVASITAGRTGMGFRGYMLADSLGHVSFGLILALFGQSLLSG